MSKNPPTPPGVRGMQANVQECLRNAGTAGATAGPLTVNALGQMVPYGASLAGLDRLGSSNIGAQNRQPMRLTAAPAMLAPSAGTLSTGPCPCGATPSAGGSGLGAAAAGANANSMTSCDLNAAACIKNTNAGLGGDCPRLL